MDAIETDSAKPAKPGPHCCTDSYGSEHGAPEGPLAPEWAIQAVDLALELASFQVEFGNLRVQKILLREVGARHARSPEVFPRSRLARAMPRKNVSRSRGATVGAAECSLRASLRSERIAPRRPTIV